MTTNYDLETIKGFGQEWRRFDQSPLSEEELQEHFDAYFKIFPWNVLPDGALGLDIGCGSGRWAKLVAPRVGHLLCVDASRQALEVAKGNLTNSINCDFLQADIGYLPLEDNMIDFGYSLGVLHHVPDTASGIQSCVNKLKPGAPFLLYLYYAFDNRPKWFKRLWSITDLSRRLISRAPFMLKYPVTQMIALFIYYPLSRVSLLFERLGCDVGTFPLSAYRTSSFYTMRTDALDRFGTKLEKRFTRDQIRVMMERAGLVNIQFSSESPFWCAVGIKK